MFLGIAVLTLAITFGIVACDPDDGGKIPKDFGIEMVQVPPVGTPTPYSFVMGSPEEEVGMEPVRETPTRTVIFTQGFRMGKYPITQGQYRAVMGKNPSFHQGAFEDATFPSTPAGIARKTAAEPNWEVENPDMLPVECVGWYEMVEFCNILSELEGRTKAYNINKAVRDPNNINTGADDVKWSITLIPGTNGYRLPTEAQWEYACRAGTTTPFSTGETITTDQANFNGTKYLPDDEEGEYRGTTTPVDKFPANGWGLYDMHGNVYEACWDFIMYAWTEANSYINYYTIAENPDYNPIGMAMGERRAERGGTYGLAPRQARSAWRERCNQTRNNYDDLGFRLVLPLEGQTW
jgi:formylglycine-generating enzyme required for sulfatase activity